MIFSTNRVVDAPQCVGWYYLYALIRFHVSLHVCLHENLHYFCTVLWNGERAPAIHSSCTFIIIIIVWLLSFAMFSAIYNLCCIKRCDKIFMNFKRFWCCVRFHFVLMIITKSKSRCVHSSGIIFIFHLKLNIHKKICSECIVDVTHIFCLGLSSIYFIYVICAIIFSQFTCSTIIKSTFFVLFLRKRLYAFLAITWSFFNSSRYYNVCYHIQQLRTNTHWLSWISDFISLFWSTLSSFSSSSNCWRCINLVSCQMKSH